MSATSACADPEWPPPPADAAASCVYELRADDWPGVSKSTLYYDGNDRVFRVDGDDGLEKATYTMKYDDLGRLVEELGPKGAESYTYSDNEIDATGIENYTLELVDGRVVRAWNAVDFEYDAAGQLTSYSGGSAYRKFTYDAQGRVVRVDGDSSFGYSLVYDETPDQLTISVSERGQPWNEIRFDFDAQHRVIHSSAERGTVGGGSWWYGLQSSYVYGDGFIEETSAQQVVRATGHCPLPAYSFVPRGVPVPIQWSAAHVRLEDQAEHELQRVLD